MNDNKKNLLGGLFALVIGIGLSIYSIFYLKSFNEKKDTFKEVIGSVVDYKYDYSDNNGFNESAAVIVEYVVDGKTYKVESGSYSSIPDSLGTKISVMYNPTDPSDAYIKGEESNSIIMPIVGGVFTLVGIAFLVQFFKNKY